MNKKLVRFTPKQLQKNMDFLKTSKIMGYDVQIYTEILEALKNAVDEDPEEKKDKKKTISKSKTVVEQNNIDKRPKKTKSKNTVEIVKDHSSEPEPEPEKETKEVTREIEVALDDLDVEDIDSWFKENLGENDSELGSTNTKVNDDYLGNPSDDTVEEHDQEDQDQVDDTKQNEVKQQLATKSRIIPKAPKSTPGKKSFPTTADLDAAGIFGEIK